MKNPAPKLSNVPPIVRGSPSLQGLAVCALGAVLLLVAVIVAVLVFK